MEGVTMKQAIGDKFIIIIIIIVFNKDCILLTDINQLFKSQ
jgi:hypothetical protein